MKKLSILCLVLLSYTGQAANYYFSTSAGDDNRSAAQAQNPATPWKSIEKLNAAFSSFQPGDVIYLKRGDTFYGTINISISGTASSPITFNAYGSGNKPIITGFTSISGWSAAGNNIYEASHPALGSRVNMLLLNGYNRHVGRYPNATAANKGYLYFQSAVTNTSIVDNHLLGKNFNGGDIVIRKNRWVLDRNKILLHTGNTITYTSQSGYWADNGYSYFIQNHPSTLDQEGEWYYNASTRKIGIYTANANSNLRSVHASTLDVIVQVQNHSYIVFDNIAFTGSTKHTFFVKNAQHVQIKNCDLLYNGTNAITADNSHHIVVENSTINHSNNIAFNGISGSNNILKNNIITNTGVFTGMGDGDSGSYEAVMLNGSNNTVELNKIDSTGYIPITFNGNDINIANNTISNFAFVKDDGGAIYTWNNGSNAPSNYNRTIKKNIILNGIGASEGTPDPGKKYAHGIYIDDNASHVNIDGNSVSSCGGFGIYVHNARDLSIVNNTVYNNRVQLEMEHDDIAPNSPVRNNVVTNNILFSLLADQPVAEYKSRNDDLANFGTFNNNYYCRPIDNNAVINTLKKVNGSYIFQQVDLDGWKSMHGKDLQSVVSPKEFAKFSINHVTGNNQFTNGSFNSNIGGLYAYSNANNCVTTWNNGALDGGSLQVSFSSQAVNNNKGTVIIGVGAVAANKTYLLKFSLKGTDNPTMMEVYLRKSLSPYNDITSRHLVKIKSNRKEIAVVFTPTESLSNASIGIDIPEQPTPVYLDNIELVEANVTLANVQDSVRFVYNASVAGNNFALGSTYVDATNTTYNASISLPAFSSAVLMKTSTGTATPPAASCSATGSILQELWENIPGNDIANINWNSQPTKNKTLTAFEAAVDAGENFGSRIRGFICPPQTGNYTFFIAGDDATELYISTSDDPANKVRIAYSLSWTSFREWNKFSSQKSLPIRLEAGKKYYIEALHKEGNGGDHVSVAWQLPSGEMEAPIPGNRLSPFQASTSVAADQTIDFSPIADVTVGAAPFALVATATSGLPVSFRVVSGNATISNNQCTVTGGGNIVIEASQAGNASFNPAPVVSRTFTATAASTCGATGSILREVWNNVAGNNISDNNWNNNPHSSSQLSQFEGPTNAAESYASRIRGYICPPVSGNYTFWIAGDDATELYVSTDANPANKRRIAYSLSWTGEREWNRFTSQKSALIRLEAGTKYYIEAIHKEGNGGDHLSVAWQLPNGVFEAPIAGSRLSPFEKVAVAADQSIHFAPLADVTVGTAPFQLTATSTSGLPVSFKVISGPATITGNTLTVIGAGTVVIEATQAGNSDFLPAPAVSRNLVVHGANQCAATGFILREYWQQVGGNNLWQNNWSGTPHSSSLINSFEGPVDVADNYASRIRGYICAPQDGYYTFWISGDDATELRISNDMNPANARKIAFSLSWTGPREWHKYATQKSALIYLEASKSYYIEAIQKEGGGGDHLAVGWELPSGNREMPIPGSRLSPFAHKQEVSNSIFFGARMAVETPINKLAGASIQVVPNPVVHTSKVTFTVSQAGMTSVDLVDMQGRVLRNLFSGMGEANVAKTIELQAAGLAPGVYIVKLTNSKEVKSSRILISR
ncbi:PA14 domain-containing protein [Aridibaculum aurantiacum]|uniref:PA14 domain-containing protein n=1 Tax=Aridibaculum aurantiacum TaxID=2810307 RepID=UPI001A96A09C|nr:PA14 domain-containing protein [Aridibaculum aurantiacum]